MCVSDYLTCILLDGRLRFYEFAERNRKASNALLETYKITTNAPNTSNISIATLHRFYYISRIPSYYCLVWYQLLFYTKCIRAIHMVAINLSRAVRCQRSRKRLWKLFFPVQPTPLKTRRETICSSFPSEVVSYSTALGCLFVRTKHQNNKQTRVVFDFS